jgi:hypothetical protein
VRREKIRAAYLRHGFSWEAEEVALRAFGEDPAQFQELLESLWEAYNPTDAAQEGLVIRLARATWLLNRADRMQEGYALRQAQDINIGRVDRLHAQMMRLKITADRVRLLAQAVARPHYVTTPEDLEKMKNLHQEGVLKEMGEIALALFYQLREPGAGEGGLDSMEAARQMVAQVKEIFGIGTRPPFSTRANVAPDSSQPPGRPPQAQGGEAPAFGPAHPNVAPDFSPAHPNVAPDFSPAHANVAPDFSPAPADLPTKSGQVPVGTTQDEQEKRYPYIPAAEWERRERPRQLLENILTRQVESCEAQRKAILKESLKGPSPYERAAEIALTHPMATHLRRLQDNHLREIRRVTNLLLRLKRRAGEK